MPQLFTNNARATLTAAITATATSLTVDASKADLFPAANVGAGSVPSTSNWFKATIQNSAGDVEIVYVRTRSSGSAVFSNVIRGQEGTTALAFAAGSVVGLRVTSADMQTVANVLTSNNVFSGTNGFTGLVTFSAAVSAEAGGALAGTFTGTPTFTGLLGASISGNAGTVTNGVYTVGNQSISGDKTFTGATAIYNLTVGTGESSSIVMSDSNEGSRQIHNNSNQIGFLTQGNSWGAYCDDDGNWTAVGNVTGYSDERLKKDWAELDSGFIEALSRVKCGTYTRIDTGERQVGVSAQSLRPVIPEGVIEGESLSVAYGNVALAAAVELAKAVVVLRAELDRIKGGGK